MVNFTVDEIRVLMDVPKNIRNISVIAHVDHGKSTLTDSLIGHAGIIAAAKAGDTRFMDTREDEQDRTITIKSTAVSLYFAMPKKLLHTLEMQKEDAKLLKARRKAEKKAKKEGKELEAFKLPERDTEGNADFLINLIDSPGHVDFSSEVTAALRVTDGALVVVDCVEGVCVQTETVLRQAISERIKPVLFVNKLDRVFLELHMDLEDAYQSFARAVESVNVIIATYNDELLGDVTVYPDKGTVGFGSGLHGWGFTLHKFARTYAAKMGVDADFLAEKFWGDNFWNPKKRKWTNKRYNKKTGEANERGFCKFVLSPINTLIESVMNEKVDIYNAMLEKLSVKIPKDAKELLGKPLLKRIMQTWLPAAETLLAMIINHLPSPVIAQKYRVGNLYSGPMDDEVAIGMANCDPNAPLMLYVSKMVPTSEKGRFYAFGRVFSGTVATGQNVRIQGPDYKPGSKKDLFKKKIQRTVLMMGRYIEQLSDCPCGNIVGLVGVDAYLLKSGSVTTYDKAYNIHTMKYSVSPVVRVAVDVTNASDLPKLMEGLKRLSKSDPLVQCITGPTGEHIVAGAGELHLEICMKDLREQYMKGAPIRVSEPVVSFMETITAESSQTCISKSPNKHNRIYLVGQPISQELTAAILDKEIKTEGADVKERARILADTYGWDVNDARKIWSFGCPPDALANVLVDSTKGVQYMNEIKDHMVGAFFQVTSGGVFCEELMRGCRFDIEDIVMHADAIHRGAGQIMPPTKRAVFATQIKSAPSLLEPLYLCDITVPIQAVAGVYSTLNQRRGMVDQTIERPGTPLCLVKAYLPVLESFGFTQLLRQNTSGQAFPQLIFSHFQSLNGDIYDEGSQVHEIVMAVRKRKGLKDTLPEFTDYFDKI